MLLRALFAVAFIGVLSSMMVTATASLARARLHRAATTAADAAFARAVTALTSDLSAAIAGGADPRAAALPLPSVPPTCVAFDAVHGCSATATTSVRDTTTTSTTSIDCAPLCARDLQGNDAVREGRHAYVIRVSVMSPGGATIARRDRYVVMRTLRVAPYAVVAGTRDATGDGISGDASEGDDGGVPAITTIDVRYVNAASGRAMPANAWQSRGWNDGDAGGTAWEP